MSRKIKILLVEDRDFSLDLIKGYLADLDPRLDIVASGEVALLKMAKTKYDLVILDIHLAGKIDGIQMLKTAETQGIAVPPVIVLSEFDTFEHMGEAYRLGVFDFVPKHKITRSFKDKVTAAVSQKVSPRKVREFYCFKHPQGCRGVYDDIDPNTVFVGIKFEPDRSYREGIKPTIESLNLISLRADEKLRSGDFSCKICAIIKDCRCAVFDISEFSSNVFLEIGFACALGKEIVIMKRTGTELPSNLSGFEVIEYSEINEIKPKLSGYLERFKVE
jgi:CheY-like chemotaxis protein